MINVLLRILTFFIGIKKKKKKGKKFCWIEFGLSRGSEFL